MKYFTRFLILFGIITLTISVITGNLGTAISGLMVYICGGLAYLEEHIDQKFEELYKKLNKGDDLE